MNSFEAMETIPHPSKIKGGKFPYSAYEDINNLDKSEFLRRINGFGKNNPDFKSSIDDIKNVLTTLSVDDIEAFNKIYTEEWENDKDKGFKEFCNQIEEHIHSIDPYDIERKRKDKRTILKEALLNYLSIRGLSEKSKLKSIKNN
jgi:hypothetical protein